MVSCDDKTSLQEFYVEKQETKNYKALDLSTSLILNEKIELDSAQEATLKTIKKVNILAYPISEENKTKYETEKAELTKVFEDEEYSKLMSYRMGSQQVEIFFLGEEEAIDELIVVGYDDEKGFGVARVLGDNMNPDDVMKLMKSFDKGDINSGSFKEISELFKR